MSLNHGYRASGPALLGNAFAGVGRAALAPVHAGRDVALDAMRVPIYDQGRLGSCVANAGIFCLSYVLRTTAPLSRLMAYYDARLAHGEADRDEGTYPHTLVASLAAVGVGTEAEWPYDTDRVFERPTDYSYQQAYDHRVTTGHALDGDGTLLADLEDSLRADVPVFGGWQIPRSFEDYQGGLVTTFDGIVAGGHSMAIVGVARRLDGSRVWTLRNSWGQSFGIGGYAEVTDDVVRGGSDFCVFGPMP